jgi:uncharacterized membrane protein YgcG
MRLALLSAVLLFSLHTCLATVPGPISLPIDPAAKSPVKNTLHPKPKGTVGFISGLLLGPVGLGGVYLLSHNHAQRRAAKKGCVIFATVVVVAALCWLIVLGAKNAGGSGAGSGSTRSSGSGSRSSGGSGRSGGSGGSHSPNSDWANNINFPGTGSSSPAQKKKPAPAQLPADWPSTIFLKY